MDFFERLNQIAGSFVCYIDLWQEILKDIIRPGNFARYQTVTWLRQQKKTFKEIGKIMGITGSRVAVLSNHIDFKIKYQKQWRISNELKNLIKKYNH